MILNDNEPTNYITTNIDSWSDEEVLTNFFRFFPRVSLINKLLENDEGAVVAQVLITLVGEKVVYSEPNTLEWPLIPAPKPDMGGLVATIH